MKSAASWMFDHCMWICQHCMPLFLLIDCGILFGHDNEHHGYYCSNKYYWQQGINLLWKYCPGCLEQSGVCTSDANRDREHGTPYAPQYGSGSCFLNSYAEPLEVTLHNLPLTVGSNLIPCIFSEAQVYMVGNKTNLTEIPPLTASNSLMNIDLIGISKNNKGTVAIFSCLILHLTIFTDPVSGQTGKTQQHPARF